jgi:protein-disulfide isomerase
MKPTRLIATLTLAAPLALALAACEGGEADALEGDVIDPIEAPAGTNWGETVTVSEEGGYILGNPEAPLKLVEYASHTCPACANFSVNGKPGVKEYVATGVVSFEQREVFLNPFDVVIAGLAMCGPDELFQPLSDEVWGNLDEVRTGLTANQEAIAAAGNLPLGERFVRIAEVTGLIEFFAARGISADQGRACLSDTASIEAMVDQVTAQAEEDNVQGTPSFFLNGNRVDGIQWSDIEPVLQRAGARQE